MLLLNEVDLQEHKGKIEARAIVCIHDKLHLQLWKKKSNLQTACLEMITVSMMCLEERAIEKRG